MKRKISLKLIDTFQEFSSPLRSFLYRRVIIYLLPIISFSAGQQQKMCMNKMWFHAYKGPMSLRFKNNCCWSTEKNIDYRDNAQANIFIVHTERKRDVRSFVLENARRGDIEQYKVVEWSASDVTFCALHNWRRTGKRERERERNNLAPRIAHTLSSVPRLLPIIAIDFYLSSSPSLSFLISFQAWDQASCESQKITRKSSAGKCIIDFNKFFFLSATIFVRERASVMVTEAIRVLITNGDAQL